MKTDIDKLDELAWGYRATRVLHTANSVGIFEVLHGQHLPLKEICKAANTEPVVTEKLLIACVAMELVEKKDDCYKNSSFSEKYLVQGSVLYQGDIIAHSAGFWDYWGNLESQVRLPGKKPFAKEDNHSNFILGMKNITVAGRGELFLNSIDLTGRKRLFDVGGGPGTYSIIACKKHPQLNAVVFDLPETIEITRKMIAEENLQDRITTIEGNWDCDEFGCDNDVVLFSNVLHGHQSNAQVKLQKAQRSLSAGGMLVIQEFLLNENKTGPLFPALFNIMVGAFAIDEIKQFIENAGFVNIQTAAQSKDRASTWLTAKKP